MVETRTLQLLEVTPESWAPFGRIPSDEGTEHDDADLEFLLDDGHANFIGHDNAEIRFTDRGGALCELLNRHDTHTQTLMPVDVEAYVVVARRRRLLTQAALRVGARLPAASPRRRAPDPGYVALGPVPAARGTGAAVQHPGSRLPNDNGIAWLTRDHDVVYEVVHEKVPADGSDGCALEELEQSLDGGHDVGSRRPGSGLVREPSVLARANPNRAHPDCLRGCDVLFGSITPRTPQLGASDSELGEGCKKRNWARLPVPGRARR